MNVIGLKVRAIADLLNVDNEVTVPKDTVGIITGINGTDLVVSFGVRIGMLIAPNRVIVDGMVDIPDWWLETWDTEIYIDVLPDGKILACNLSRTEDKYVILNINDINPERRCVHHTGENSYILGLWQTYIKGQY